MTPEGAERLLRIGAKVYYAKDPIYKCYKITQTMKIAWDPDGADGKRPRNVLNK